MSLEEKMVQLSHNLNSAYLELAEFLIDAKNRYDRLLVNGFLLDNPEVVMLNNVIHSSVRELNDIDEALEKVRRSVQD